MIEKLGYHKGFQTYELLDWKKGAALVDLSLEWINNRDPDKLFCLYIHFMDVHDPYKPKPPYDAKFGEDYEGRIDGEIKPFKEQLAEKQLPGLSEKDLQQLRDLYDGGDRIH